MGTKDKEVVKPRGGDTAPERLKKKGLDVKKTSGAQAAIDTISFPTGALKHPREHTFNVARKKDRELVDSIKRGWAKDSILELWEDGPALYVIDGSRRLNAARIAQSELRAEGKTNPIDGTPVDIYAPFILKTGSEADLLAARLDANTDALAEADSYSVLAASAIALAAFDWTSDQIAAHMPAHVDARTVSALLRWPNLTPKCAARFDSGEAPIALLESVLDGKRDEQESTLDRLMASGAKTRLAAKRALSTKPVVKRPSAKKLQAVVDALPVTERFQNAFAMGIGFALGKVSAKDLPLAIRADVEKAMAPQKPGPKGKS